MKPTSLPMDLVIVGGGVCGLACAYFLQKQGLKVVVLEQSDGKFRSRGYVACPPNMTRLMVAGGLQHVLDRWSTKLTGLSFRIGATGEEASILRFQAELMADLRGDFLHIQHGDLISELEDAARRLGAEIRYNAKVVGIDAHRVSATLSTGEEIRGDLLIGADGAHSYVREVVLGKQISSTSEQRPLINFAVPARLLREDDDLRELTKDYDWPIWMGDGVVAYGSITHGGEDYSVKIVGRPEECTSSKTDWLVQCPRTSVKLPCVPKFEKRVRKLVELAPDVNITTDTAMEPFDTWIHESGKVVLVGDAAHPTIPSGSHHAALAVEDAAALANLLSRPTSTSQLSRCLIAFEEIRQPRCFAVRASEIRKRDFVTLAHRGDQQLRDQRMLAMKAKAEQDWQEADEEYLAEQWGEYLQAFAYDANEEVNDWCAQWGRALMRDDAPTVNGFH